MKNIITYITKGSKLIVIYILTVLISGSILTFLSINNISNFQELTEKRVIEEERSIIENYRLQFQNTLESLAASLEKITQNDTLKLNIEGFNFENELVDDYLMMNKNGVLFSPHFLENSFNTNTETAFLNYNQNYLRAENFEFVQKKYKNAEIQYLKALKLVKTTTDSAKVFNALARLNIKTGNQKKALKLYGRIITKLSFALNDFGFPYAYFSIDQLLKLTDDDLSNDIEGLLITFLNGLANNQIPYNNSTADLIIAIQNEIDKIENKDTLELGHFLCRRINRRIIAIQDYKISTQTIIKKEETNPLIYLKNFIVIANKNKSNEIMLLQRSNENSIGYIVLLKKLDSLVLLNISESPSKFKYNIQLIDAGFNGSYFDKESIIQNNFSPFFSKKAIQVKLKDLNIIEDHVFKRKLTTIIGLLLLLGAMLIGLFTLIQDEKRKKHIEGLRADFVSNVTHELKTPLTSINMFAESILLGRVKSEKDLIKYTNVIVKESERLKRMINNILDFSRKENEKLAYHLKECDLLEVVNSTMDEMNYWLEINKFEVTLDLQENIIAKVDPEGIKQVLSNLISNAIKYSDIKKKLIVRLYKKRGKAFIEIEDQGIGIPKEKHKSIFEKFYRINSHKNENISGTGLGLTVSRDIIEAQNGELLVNSSLDIGSTFTIVLDID